MGARLGEKMSINLPIKMFSAHAWRFGVHCALCMHVKEYVCNMFLAGCIYGSITGNRS